MTENIKYTIYIDNNLVSKDQTDTEYDISSLALGDHNIKISGKCQHAVVESSEMAFTKALPANTLRFRFSNETTDPTTLAMEKGTWTKATDSEDNDWDFTYNNSDWSNLFGGKLTSSLDSDIKLIGSGDTSNVTDMSMVFAWCSSLTSLDLSNFDTSNVKDMSYMFCGNNSLISLDLSSFDTTKVTNMSFMFRDCGLMESLNVSSFNTSNVKDMSYMFGCDDDRFNSPLTSLDLSNFDTSNVTNMNYMFAGYEGLTTLNISSFNTSNVTTMQGMFYICRSLPSLDLSSFDTTKVTNMSFMFYSCSSLTTLDMINSFNVNKVTDMAYMFYYCTNVKSGMLAFYNKANATGKVTSYANCFTNCGTDGGATALAERAHIPTTWGGDGAEMSLTATSEVNETTATISYTITNGNYDTWTVTCNGESTTGTTGSFEFTDLEPNTYTYTVTAKCAHNVELSTEVSFTIENQHADFNIIIDDYTEGDEKLTWHTISLEPNTLRFRFSNDATDPTTLAMTKGTWTKVADSEDNDWDFTYNNTDWSGLFDGKLTSSLDSDIKLIGSGDTSNVTNMARMFELCNSLTSVDLSNFNTSNVTDMSDMFSGCISLTSLDLSSFDTSSVTDMSYMINGCGSLTTLDLSSFDTSNVTDMSYMFYGNSSLTSLSMLNTFNVNKVTNVQFMFKDCAKVENGMLAFYTKANATGKVTEYSGCFAGCGANGGETALAERAQIPASWGGNA